ncbi:MAG: ATP-binding protein [Candidatus ainarchaeum sp.]|nr:ATP-binding protein [Candidatus ainarchaeum sp.]
MQEIDVADLPIEELELNLAVFAHDCHTAPLYIRNTFDILFLGGGKDNAPHVLKASGLAEKFMYDLMAVIDKHTKIRRNLKIMSRDEVRGWIQKYKQDLLDVNKSLKSFEDYWSENKKRIIIEGNEAFELGHKQSYKSWRSKTLEQDIDESLELYKSHFSIDKLGLPISAGPYSLQEENLYDFFSKWSKREFRDRDGQKVDVIFRGRPVSGLKVDTSLLQRTIYNIMTDAINHTPGRPVYITLGEKDGRIWVSVTNEGRKLNPEEIRKIGRERYSRRMDDPRRGYGKIMVRMATEAMGGQFHVGNSKIGPLLQVSFPSSKPPENKGPKKTNVVKLIEVRRARERVKKYEFKPRKEPRVRFRI